MGLEIDHQQRRSNRPYFCFRVIAELVDEPEIRKSNKLIDTLMSHIVKNDFYLIDWNGEPTLWGKWNPEYVNALDVMVGDRKLNSSNIIGMLLDCLSLHGERKIPGCHHFI